MIVNTLKIPHIIEIYQLFQIILDIPLQGFGDIAPSHRIAVLNFIPILIGLSVVSMSINVIQSQLEVLFSKIVKRIDKDFKDKIVTSMIYMIIPEFLHSGP